MFSQFNKILTQFALASIGSSMRPHTDKISPFKAQMNMDIPNLEGKFNIESIENWVQQIESYYSMNQHTKAEKITIASLKMSTSVHY